MADNVGRLLRLFCAFLNVCVDVDPSYCHYSSPSPAALFRYDIGLDCSEHALNRLVAVPDNYIGALSSSLFAGMMIGAVGWGTCACYVLQMTQHCSSTHYLLIRLRRYGTDYCIQCHTLLYRYFWPPRVIRQLVQDAMRYFILPWQFSGGESK